MPRTVKMQAVLAEPASEPEERKFWTLTIDPAWSEFSGYEYFYDGEVKVNNGVALIPVERTDWVRRLLMSNYTLDPEQEAEFYAVSPEA